MLKTKNTELQSDLNDYMGTAQKLQKDKSRLKRNLQIFIDENKEAANHIRKMESKLKDIINTNGKLLEEKKKYLSQISNLTQYNTELANQIEQLKSDLNEAEINDKIKSLKN